MDIATFMVVCVATSRKGMRREYERYYESLAPREQHEADQFSRAMQWGLGAAVVIGCMLYLLITGDVEGLARALR